MRGEGARVAILTPDPADEAWHSRWRDVLDEHRKALAPIGLEAIGRSWVEPATLDAFDLVLPLLAWGYHRDLNNWVRRTEEWQASGVAIANPPSVLRWNADKSYLGRLAASGAPVVPTEYAEAVDLAFLREAAARFGTDRLVVKPRVSASAWQTILWSEGEGITGGPSGPALVQPFLPSIIDEGEVSLFFFDGILSHAVAKRPVAGDFRVQPEYQGRITPHDPAADEIDAAETVLRCIEEPILYARIDLVRDGSGQPKLMEAELVEPDLYLEHDPERGALFAASVARLVNGYGNPHSSTCVEEA